MRRIVETRRSELGRLGAQMAALSPLAVLERGYAITRKGDEVIRDPAQVQAGDRLELRVARGTIDVIVAKIDENS